MKVEGNAKPEFSTNWERASASTPVAPARVERAHNDAGPLLGESQLLVWRSQSRNCRFHGLFEAIVSFWCFWEVATGKWLAGEPLWDAPLANEKRVPSKAGVAARPRALLPPIYKLRARLWEFGETPVKIFPF